MRDLEPLFAPSSVAILGASTDPSKWGNWLALAALEGADRRTVHLVNRRGGEIAGRACVRDLAEAGGGVECVVVAVPEAALEEAVEQSLAQGARALIVITAGLGERDSAGRARELALAARVRAAGAVMLGPNCIGVYDGAASFRVSSNSYPTGALGLISQSGNLSIELGMLCDGAGLGLSRFASTGNQADIGLPDLIEHLAAHDGTEVIGIYVEDVADGRAFVAAARSAAERKPVVLLNSGRSAAGARGAASHTGALVSDDAIVAAACRAAGVIRVDSPGALVDAALALMRTPRARGRRVAVVADGGGHGSVAADLATAAGFEVPVFSESLAARVAGELRVRGGVANPVDLVDGKDGLVTFTTLVRHVMESGEVDAVLLSGYYGGYAMYSEEYREAEPREARLMAALPAETGIPLVVHSLFADLPEGRDLRDAGLAVYARIEQAVGALGALVAPAPPIPVPGTFIGDPTRVEQAMGASNPLSAAEAVPAPSSVPGTFVGGSPLVEPGFLSARRLLAAAGIPYGDGAQAVTADEAVAVAERLGYPCVLKAIDPGLLHKSDAGGVAVGLADAASVRAAAEDMLGRLRPELLFVERQADVRDGIELVVGATRDPRFGPILLVGLGGVLVEVLADSALALAPVDPAGAEELLRSLRTAALLAGVRGRPAVDVAAASRAIAALSQVAAAHPEISEIEINPLIVTPRGCVALDARVLTDSPTGA